MSISKAELTAINNTINAEMEILPTKTLSTLTIGRTYVIEAMSIKKTKFGKAILVTLDDKIEKVKFKTWLPKRIADQFQEDQVCVIHSSPNKYSMMYMGQSIATLPGSRTRSLVVFNLME